MNKQNLCAVCSLKTTLGCSQCKQVFYCSVEHQRQHWVIHQSVCLTKQEIIKDDNSPANKPQTVSVSVPKSEKKLIMNEREQLLEDHDRYRQISIRLLSQKDYKEAQLSIRKAIDLASKLEHSREDSYEKIADQLLLVRSQINEQQLEFARRTLISIFEQVKLLTQCYKKEDQIKISQILKVMAQLFHETGDEKQCEMAYVEYILMMEKCYGEESNSVGNAYFLIGTFYIQQKHYTQSLACFRRALNIRSNINATHENVSDCWYNMGVIYKQQNKKEQAIECLERALKQRRTVIGPNSLQSAMCLEMLGKLHMQFNEYQSAYNRLQECFNIRKQLFKNNHPDIERVSKLVSVLFSKLQEQNHSTKYQMSEESIEANTPSRKISRCSQILNISNNLMESFNIDQLIQLKLIQQELTKTRNKNEQAQLILESQFMTGLSSIQMNLLKEQNSHIFESYVNPFTYQTQQYNNTSDEKERSDSRKKTFTFKE